MSVTAKSVVFDVIDNHGDSNYLGMRRIEFKNNGVLIALTSSDFTHYATNESNVSYDAQDIFDTSRSKTGSHLNGYLSLSTGGNNLRWIVVFNTEQTFDEIVINNHHNFGGSTTRGANNVKITISDDSITDTTYDAAVANSQVLNNTSWPEHAAVDAADDQTVWWADAIWRSAEDSLSVNARAQWNGWEAGSTWVIDDVSGVGKMWRCLSDGVSMERTFPIGGTLRYSWYGEAASNEGIRVYVNSVLQNTNTSGGGGTDSVTIADGDTVEIRSYVDSGECGVYAMELENTGYTLEYHEDFEEYTVGDSPVTYGWTEVTGTAFKVYNSEGGQRIGHDAGTPQSIEKTFATGGTFLYDWQCDSADEYVKVYVEDVLQKTHIGGSIRSGYDGVTVGNGETVKIEIDTLDDNAWVDNLWLVSPPAVAIDAAPESVESATEAEQVNVPDAAVELAIDSAESATEAEQAAIPADWTGDDFESYSDSDLASGLLGWLTGSVSPRVFTEGATKVMGYALNSGLPANVWMSRPMDSDGQLNYDWMADTASEYVRVYIDDVLQKTHTNGGGGVFTSDAIAVVKGDVVRFSFETGADDAAIDNLSIVPGQDYALTVDDSESESQCQNVNMYLTRPVERTAHFW